VALCEPDGPAYLALGLGVAVAVQIPPGDIGALGQHRLPAGTRITARPSATLWLAPLGLARQLRRWL
jgi:hypothetical protein